MKKFSFRSILTVLFALLCVGNVWGAKTTIFSMSVKDGASTSTVASGSIAGTDIATVSGGTLTFVNNNTKAYAAVNNKKFYLGTSSAYFKIELTSALATGDVITIPNLPATSNGLSGLCFTSSETFAKTDTTANNVTTNVTYTIPEGLNGATTLYVWRLQGKGTSFDALTITRGEDEPVVKTQWDAPEITVGEWDGTNKVYPVTITCEDGASIQYSTDGTSYSAYTAAVNVAALGTIYAKATGEGYTDSEIAQKTMEDDPDELGSIVTVNGTTTTWDFTKVTQKQAVATGWTEDSGKSEVANTALNANEYITPTWCTGVGLGAYQGASADKIRIYYNGSGVCFNGGAGSILITIPEGANTLEVYSAQTLLTSTSGVTLAAITGGYKATGLTAGTNVEIHRSSGATYITKVVTKYVESTTYAITKGTETNGTFTISPDGEQAEGTVITLAATPADGYALSAWDVYKTGESATKVTVTNNKFTMPAYAVTVDATFAEFQEPTEVDFTIDFTQNPYTITGTHMSATSVSGSWHDNQHGYSSPVVTVPVPGQVNITVATCRYNGTENITVSNGTTELFSTAAKTSSCSEVVYTYTGDAATLTVTCGNYCHYIKVKTINTEDIAVKNAAGTQYEVSANSARNLKACLAAAASDASCKTVYVPNGTYDFGTEMNIAVSGSNLHIIGQSMDDVIIKNAPTTEALKNGLIHNTGDHNTFENLTLWCQSTWGGSAERGPALFDEGNYTICKDVYLKGTQDTYFSNSTGMKYFLGGKIEGTVDFICGMGKIFFESVNLICTQSDHHTTYDIIIAPDAETGKGSNTTNGTKFVFKDAIYSGDAPSYYLGRSWKGTNTAYFGGTIFDPDFAPVGYDSDSYFTTEGQTLTDQIGAAAGGTITITAGLNVMRDYELFGEEWHPVAGLFEPHVRTMTVGNYGTVCLPFGYTVSGADIYSIEGKMVDGSDNPTAIVLRQVESAMYPAGDPYIFQATASTVTFTPKADYSTYEMTLNKLQGTFTDIDFYDYVDEKAWVNADDDYKHIYVLNNNTFKLSKWTAAGQSGVRAYRAYIGNMDDVEVYDPAQGGEAPVRIMGIADETGVVTDIENATLVNPAEIGKMILNGKVVIFREGKMYDMMGRTIK